MTWKKTKSYIIREYSRAKKLVDQFPGNSLHVKYSDQIWCQLCDKKLVQIKQTVACHCSQYTQKQSFGVTSWLFFVCS